jgi:hypothetical protein
VLARFLAHSLGGLPPFLLEATLEVLEPQLHLGPIDLEVKLQSPRRLADAKRLDGDPVPLGEGDGCLREPEGVLVPVEDEVAVGVVREKRILLRCRKWPDRLEADLALGGGEYRAVERAGQDLRAEADAEIGRGLRDGPERELPVPDQEGVALHLIDVHRAAEHDDAADLADVGPGRRGLERV